MSDHVIMPGPARVVRGALTDYRAALIEIATEAPLIIAGSRSRHLTEPLLALPQAQWSAPVVHCSERELAPLLAQSKPAVIGIGGGKVLDAAKLVAERAQVPVITIPTSAATCAAWTALSNVYDDTGAFLYDVPLSRSPELLILDYGLVAQAPVQTLRAGIADALAKWYEASVSSGDSDDAIVIAAVQQARVLRDMLLQQGVTAVQQPGSTAWRQMVDASICLAGIMGGLGGAACRTVAAHAIHNGLTHAAGHKAWLHGEKVAFGILVQLRLEELLGGRQLAAAARAELLPFYQALNLPTRWAELGLGTDTIATVAEIACRPGSDIHRLPFAVTPTAVLEAIQTTEHATGTRDQVQV